MSNPRTNFLKEIKSAIVLYAENHALARSRQRVFTGWIYLLLELNNLIMRAGSSDIEPPEKVFELRRLLERKARPRPIDEQTADEFVQKIKELVAEIDEMI